MTPPQILSQKPPATATRNRCLGACLAIIRACHPEPTAAVTVGASMLAMTAGASAARTALIGVAVLAGQLSVGWSNDWFDAARDRAVGRDDKPIATYAVSARAVAVAALTAAVLTAVCSLLLGPLAGVLHLVAVAAAWLYNWPLKNTAASVAPYLVAFGLLPSFVVTALPHHPMPPPWLIAAGALLGGGAHFANALPDLADDAQTGVRGLPHRIGSAGSRVTAVGFLLAAGGVLVAAPAGPAAWSGMAVLAASGLAMAGAALTARRHGERLLFRTVMAVALVDVTLLVTAPVSG